MQFSAYSMIFLFCTTDVVQSENDTETSFELYKKKSHQYERERKDGSGSVEMMQDGGAVPMHDDGAEPMIDPGVLAAAGAIPPGMDPGAIPPGMDPAALSALAAGATPPEVAAGAGPGGEGEPGPAAWVMTKTARITTTVRTRRTRTTPFRLSFTEECDYLAYYCMRAYDTGRLCARTLYHVYHDFVNYCMLDYVNCMERYEVWQVVHMGVCFELEPLKEFKHYPYENDYFLDDYYLVEDII